MDVNKSTSRRQGRFREGLSEGSRSANARDDEQKPHIRLSPRASLHNMTKPAGSEGRVNAAFVCGKFTLLSGEVCMSCERRLMRGIRKGSIRLTNDPAYPPAVDGYESRPFLLINAGSQGKTQNRQQLIGNPLAPDVETYPVSMQKSAEGIVVSNNRDEGLNAEMSEAIS